MDDNAEAQEAHCTMTHPLILVGCIMMAWTNPAVGRPTLTYSSGGGDCGRGVHKGMGRQLLSCRSEALRGTIGRSHPSIVSL